MPKTECLLRGDKAASRDRGFRVRLFRQWRDGHREFCEYANPVEAEKDAYDSYNEDDDLAYLQLSVEITKTQTIHASPPVFKDSLDSTSHDNVVVLEWEGDGHEPREQTEGLDRVIALME